MYNPAWKNSSNNSVNNKENIINKIILKTKRLFYISFILEFKMVTIKGINIAVAVN